MKVENTGTFTFLDWEYQPQTGQLLLNYHDSLYGHFTEQFEFPAISNQRFLLIESALTTAINCLHWMAGVSYYKTALARNIVVSEHQPNPGQALWLEQTWQSGLAELAYENKLPWLDFIKFPSAVNAVEATDLNLKPRSLVAIGGGKDSIVTIEALKSQQEDQHLFQVGRSPFIQSVADKTGLPLIQINRKVDQRLKQLNEQGAFNGHVPITAINSCVAVVTALIMDFDSVVFSNERSADSGNVVDDQGRSINHQYSKSMAFEQSWHAIIKQSVAADLDYFSLLRPFSELHIVREFAALEAYFPYFSSCNRNFHLAGSQNTEHHWCGQCPKCAFVFLCLAPFVSKQTILNIFKKDLLADVQLQELFAALLGLVGQKPFECVGEAAECQQAIHLLSQHPEWQHHVQVRKWIGSLGDLPHDTDFFNVSAIHQIPDKRNFKRILSQGLLQ